MEKPKPDIEDYYIYPEDDPKGKGGYHFEHYEKDLSEWEEEQETEN